MKKILIVGDFLTGSGLTRFIFNVFENLTGCEVYAIGYGNEKSDKIDKKCNLRGWKFRRIIPVTTNPLKHWLEWRKILKEKQFDIIYFNYSSSWNFLPLKIAKKYQQGKIVCHSHNSFYSHAFKNRILMFMLNRLNEFGKRVFYKDSDIKIATSNEAAKWMFGSDKNVNIINNGIRISDFIFDSQSRKIIRKNLNISSNEILVGFVGVLQKRKNPLFVIEVFNEFHKEKPNSKLIMIGRGELKQEIVKKVNNLGLSDVVKLLDYSDEINKLYSAMDILVFPSLYEGFGLVPLEAQVSNLPIFVSINIPISVCVTPAVTRIAGFKVKKWKDQMLKFKVHRTAIVDNNLYKYSSTTQFKEIDDLLKK